MIEIPARNNINVLPPKYQIQYLPFSVLRYLTGGQVTEKYERKPDVVAIEWNSAIDLLHIKDWRIVKKVGDAIWKEVIKTKNMLPSLMTTPTAVVIIEEARKRIERLLDVDKRKRVMFIKDTTGCGYWRMVYPARYMDEKKYIIDCNEVEVMYDFLLEYDTIVVQRIHRWDQYYVLEKLVKNGKKVIYDIDDDIFSIPFGSPGFEHIKLSVDNLEAARAIMDVCSRIVTPSSIIAERFGHQAKTVVIPNALDLDDGWPQFKGIDSVDDAQFTSPDGVRRILWQGSITHEVDWNQCIDAVDEVLKKHDDVNVAILGLLPRCIRERLESGVPHWVNRVEYCGFNDIETYVSILKQIRAEVAIAPLQATPFNEAKSCLKFVEYAAIGAPTVASNVTPYKEVIKNGKNGFLASTKDEWVEHIELLLEGGQTRLDVIKAARKTVSDDFNIRSVVQQWEDLL